MKIQICGTYVTGKRWCMYMDHVCSVHTFVGHYMYIVYASLGVLKYVFYWENYTTVATCVGGA